jgi:hypothetical protein
MNSRLYPRLVTKPFVVEDCEIKEDGERWMVRVEGRCYEVVQFNVLEELNQAGRVRSASEILRPRSNN